mmetsp:Transcript_2428/g.5808  ORF Transcript_2428/g.5808 Transcript_2428/m.5808 type:complete len:205 (-) Transcript_2428:76-690(-)
MATFVGAASATPTEVVGAALGRSSPKVIPISSRTWLTIASSSSSFSSPPRASSSVSPMISCIISVLAFSFSNSSIILLMAGTSMALFILAMAFPVDVMASAMAWWDFTVCSLRAQPCRWLRISINFVMYCLVRTKSLAMIFTAPICPSFAHFLISMVSLFSSRSSSLFSRSNSRTARLIIRLFSRRTSFRGLSLPSMFPMVIYQ